ncbi:hypothetical protein ACWGY7_18695 [Xanthomonas axonopodis pv. khayae]
MNELLGREREGDSTVRIADTEAEQYVASDSYCDRTILNFVSNLVGPIAVLFGGRIVVLAKISPD